MDKVLVILQDTSKWIYDGRLSYNHIDSDLKISWGWEGNYAGSTNHHNISSPAYEPIPSRYRKKIGVCINAINNHMQNDIDDIEFLNQYLDGEYIMGIKIVDSTEIKKSRLSLWLAEQGMSSWYISQEKIWFKNEEDIMAFKLRWE